MCIELEALSHVTMTYHDSVTQWKTIRDQALGHIQEMKDLGEMSYGFLHYQTLWLGKGIGGIPGREC